MKAFETFAALLALLYNVKIHLYSDLFAISAVCM